MLCIYTNCKLSKPKLVFLIAFILQVRYSQLMKQQEHMIREMEQSVTRRDFISYQGDAIQKKSSKNKKGVTMGDFQRKLIELQNKIKSTKKVSNLFSFCQIIHYKNRINRLSELVKLKLCYSYFLNFKSIKFSTFQK